MKLIYIDPNPSGSYPPILESDFHVIPPDMALWPETLSTDMFYDHNGFVTLTVEDMDGVPTVTGYEPSLEAWEAWKASLPPDPEPITPQPTAEERLSAMESAMLAIMMGG